MPADAGLASEAAEIGMIQTQHYSSPSEDEEQADDLIDAVLDFVTDDDDD